MNDEQRWAEQSLEERRMWSRIFVAGLLTALVMCAFGWQFVAPRLNAAKSLDRTVALTGQTDPLLAQLDSAIATAVATPTTESAVALEDMQPRIADARAALGEAVASIDIGMPRLADEEQRLARLVRSAAGARLGALDAVPAIVASAKAAASNEASASIAELERLTRADSAYRAARRKAAEADAAIKAL